MDFHATLQTVPCEIIAMGRDFVQCQMFVLVILDTLDKTAMNVQQIIVK
jgi:hypothetical protein